MNIVYATQFKKDYKRVKKQGKNLAKLRTVIEQLASHGKLDPKHRDHGLSGKWTGRRDCHIEPDWVLIYRLTENELRLERTGSHAELFK